MGQKYCFVCPTCEERILVDGHVRDEMLVDGCAICSSRVAPNCFDPI